MQNTTLHNVTNTTLIHEYLQNHKFEHEEHQKNRSCLALLGNNTSLSKNLLFPWALKGEI
jgi:hypothetical protein